MTQTRTTKLRLVAAALVTCLPAVVLVATRAAWHERLPAKLPTHWSGLETPDRFTTTTSLWTGMFVLAAAAVVLALVATAMDRRDPSISRGLLILAGSVAGLTTTIWLISATAPLAANSVGEARLDWRIAWVVAGLAWGLVPYAIAGRPPARSPSPVTDSTGDIDLAPGERAAWTATLHSRMLVTVLVVAIVAVAVAAVTAASGAWFAVGVLVATLAVFGQVQVTVDHRGLRLVVGILGLRFKHIPLAKVESASAQHVDPKWWGGWGYRMLPGRSALVLRSGPGLVLELSDGRSFAVTLDDPQTPAALLTALRRSSPSGSR